MLKVIDVKIDGTYYTATFENGITEVYHTCPCGNGCGNTDRLLKIGMEFESCMELYKYLGWM